MVEDKDEVEKVLEEQLEKEQTQQEGSIKYLFSDCSSATKQQQHTNHSFIFQSPQFLLIDV